MIQQIISHTPLYVWALLAFLIYRGVLACSDRETTVRNLFIIPVVMLALSLQDLTKRFPMDALHWTFWLAGAAAGAALAWNMMGGKRIVADRASGTVMQRGTPVLLILMLCIFASKYTVAVLMAMRPETQGSLQFAAIVCSLFGVFNGVLTGRLLRYVAAYLRQPAALAA